MREESGRQISFFFVRRSTLLLSPLPAPPLLRLRVGGLSEGAGKIASRAAAAGAGLLAGFLRQALLRCFPRHRCRY